MADALIEFLLQELDLAVIEWLPDRSFRTFTAPPRWFKGMAQWSSLPFLEHFLPEAEEHWRQNAVGVLTSGPFMIENAGEELLLRARALKLEGRLVMAIERMIGDADTRPILREARQQALDHEQLEDHARAVHGPADAIAKAVHQLGAAGLSGDQQQIVDGLAKASAKLTEVAAHLPKPRPRRSR